MTLCILLLQANQERNPMEEMEAAEASGEFIYLPEGGDDTQEPSSSATPPVQQQQKQQVNGAFLGK